MALRSQLRLHKMNVVVSFFPPQVSAARNNRAEKVEFYSNSQLEICGKGAAKQECRGFEDMNMSPMTGRWEGCFG